MAQMDMVNQGHIGDRDTLQFSTPVWTTTTTVSDVTTGLPQQQHYPPTQETFTEYPAYITCNNCKTYVVTELGYKKGPKAYLAAAILCASGLCLGCCCIPFCMKRFKDIVHICPNCKAIVGAYRRPTNRSCHSFENPYSM